MLTTLDFQTQAIFPMKKSKFIFGQDGKPMEIDLYMLQLLWTHSSTSIEGNTFTLEETAALLKDGLTIPGRSLEEHLEIKGHAKAVEYIYEHARTNKNLCEADMFELHKLVQPEMVCDVYRPVGAWKRENNGTQYRSSNGKVLWHEYPSWTDTPKLMAHWFDMCNALPGATWENAMTMYARLHLSFVSIHPFFDGNGRMARLVANLPLLRSGLPPVFVFRKYRKEYMDLCLDAQQKSTMPFPTENDCKEFVAFMQRNWHETWKAIGATKNAPEGKF